MPPIRIERFGGLVPKLDATALPDNAAVEALNCDVSSGVLAPYIKPAALTSLRNSSGVFVGNVPSAESAPLGKPETPVLASTHYKCRPLTGGWLTIKPYLFVTQVVADGPLAGSEVAAPVTAGGVTYANGTIPFTCNISQPSDEYGSRYTDDGMLLACEIPVGVSIDFASVVEYRLYGPIYQFQFGNKTLGPNGEDYGGPELAINAPISATYTDTTFPPHRIPLVWEDVVYGHFQVIDARGPNWNATVDCTEEAYYNYPVNSGAVYFDVSLNYADPVRRHFFYVTTPVDADDREGPPSEISEEIIVNPGQRHSIRIEHQPTGTSLPMNIYRSSTGGDDFRLVEEKKTGGATADDEYWDDEFAPVGDEIPPFGDMPDGMDASKVYWHPAGFAVGYVNKGDGTSELWRSDFYRPWAWPEENTVPFPETIKCVVMSGNSVIVFTTSEVYAVSGNDPELGTRTLLTDSMPVSDIKSIARIGQAVYYATTDGLAVATGSEAKLVSGGYFDRDTWDDLVVAGEEAKVGDGKLFYGNLVFDFEEDLAAVTHTDVSGTSKWKSKAFYFDQPTQFDYVRVYGTGTTTLTAYYDGKNTGAVSLPASQWVSLIDVDGEGAETQRIGRRWYFELTFTGTITRFEAVPREVRDAQDVTVLTEADTPCWRDVWLRWPDQGNWCAGSLKRQTGFSVPITFTPNSGTAVSVTASSNGLFYLPRTMARANHWRVEAGTDARIDQMTLYRRVTEAVQDSIREVNNGVVPPWRVKKYQFEGKVWPSAIEVQSLEASVPLTLYYNNTSTTYTVTPGIPVRLTTLGAVDAVEFDFGSVDDKVTEVIIYAQPAQVVGEEGVVMRDAKRYRGLPFKFVDRGRWALYSVWLDSYAGSPTLDMYADGNATARHSEALTDAKVHYFDWDNEYTTWEADVNTTQQVRELMLVPWTRQVVEKDLVLSSRDLLYPPWRRTVYQWDNEQTIKSVWVDVQDGSACWLWAYLDNSTTPVKVLIPANVETPLDLGEFKSLRIAFDNKDYLVNAVRLNMKEVIPVGPDGFFLANAPTWRMNEVTFGERAQWACGSIRTDDYTGLSLTVLKDGVATLSGSPTNANAFTFSRAGGLSNAWTVDLYRETDGVPQPLDLRSVHLMPWRDVPVEGGTIHVTSTEPAMPPWMYQRYKFVDRRKLRSVLYNGSASVTLNIYLDGASTPSHSVALTPGTETVIPDTVARCNEVDFAFSDNTVVRELFLFTEEEAVIGDQGVFLQNPVSTRMLPVKFQNAGAWACGVVSADYSDGKSVTVNLYSDAGGRETPAHTFTLTSDDLFVVPLTGRFSKWWVDVEGTDIRSIALLPWQRRVVEGDSVYSARSEQGIPEWLYTIYHFNKRTQLTSFRIDHDQTMDLSLTVHAGDGSVTQTVQDTEFHEERFSSTVPWTDDVRFSFATMAQNNAVRVVRLFSKEVIPVPQHGIILRNGEQVRSWRNIHLTFPDNGRFTVMRLVADGNVTATLSCEGVEQYSITRNYSNEDSRTREIRMWDLDTGRDWTLDLESNEPIHEVHLIGDVIVPVKQGSVIMRKQQEPWTWSMRRIVAEMPVDFSCARVVAQTYPVYLKLFDGNDEDSLKVTKVINSSDPVRLPKARPSRQWTVHAVTQIDNVLLPDVDNLIYEVGLATSMERLKG